MNALAKTENRDERWFILCTEPRRENTALGGLIGRGIRAYCPTELHTRRLFRTERKVALPLFPNYLFVRLGIRAGLFMRVEATPGVSRFLRLGQGYATIDDGGIDALRFHEVSGLDTREIPTGKKNRVIPFSVEQTVRFKEGPFGGLYAKIKSIDPRGRIRVLLDLFGRETPTDVDADEIAAA